MYRLLCRKKLLHTYCKRRTRVLGITNALRGSSCQVPPHSSLWSPLGSPPPPIKPHPAFNRIWKFGVKEEALRPQLHNQIDLWFFCCCGSHSSDDAPCRILVSCRGKVTGPLVDFPEEFLQLDLK